MLSNPAQTVLQGLLDLVTTQNPYEDRIGALWLLYAQYDAKMDYELQLRLQTAKASQELREFIQILTDQLAIDEHVGNEVFTYLLNRRPRIYDEFNMLDVAASLNGLKLGSD